jgi:pyruvate dehydrogenase E1 component alpha subunit
VAYGIPSLRCDGNDALAVYSCVREGVLRAARGGGPTLIELLTDRTGPHSSSDDPTVYRDSRPAHEAHSSDPLRRLRSYLERQYSFGTVDQVALEERVHAELNHCIERAEAAPPPSLESMFEDVYEHMPRHLVAQRAQCLGVARPVRASNTDPAR